MSYFIPFISVIFGYGIAFYFKPEKKSTLKLIMAFSGSFLLSLTVMHLLPEVFGQGHHHHHHSEEHHHGPETASIGIFIMLGILFQIILEFFSKGAEHGHVHRSEGDLSNRTPWPLFISLCLHALLEGFPINENVHLAYGIGIHHFPIAIILTTFFANSGMKKRGVFSFMFIFALMTPLGTLLSSELEFARAYAKEITAVVIGILFHISSTIIFESNENHKFNNSKITVIVLGIILAYLLEIFHVH